MREDRMSSCEECSAQEITFSYYSSDSLSQVSDSDFVPIQKKVSRRTCNRAISAKRSNWIQSSRRVLNNLPRLSYYCELTVDVPIADVLQDLKLNEKRLKMRIGEEWNSPFAWPGQSQMSSEGTHGGPSSFVAVRWKKWSLLQNERSHGSLLIFYILASLLGISSPSLCLGGRSSDLLAPFPIRRRGRGSGN